MERLKKIEETDLGYYYAKVSFIECLGWGGAGICDLCGKRFTTGYLTFVLGNCCCEDCFKSWLKSSTRYEEDLALQYGSSEEWFKYHLGNQIVMPDSYSKRKLEELNDENKKLVSNLKYIDAEINKSLKEIFPEELGGLQGGKE